VAEEVVVVRAHPVGDGGVELERHRCCGDCDGDRGVVEDPREPPDAGAATVVVMRLRPEVEAGRLDAGIRVLAPAVVAVVAPADRVFRALLVHEHDVDDDPGTAGPGESFRLRPVADEVALSHEVGDHHATIRR